MLNTRGIRPLRVTLLAIFIFFVACWNGLRFAEGLFFWQTLRTYAAHPLYIAVTGIIWLIIGSFIAWSLYTGKHWARQSSILCVIGYTVWYWFDRILLQAPDSNWPFTISVNLLLLALITYILFSAKTKRYFMRILNE